MVVQAAKTPSQYLNGFHVFVLANLVRRPILVFASRVVRGMSGDAIDCCDVGG